jgi:hypothetical protein
MTNKSGTPPKATLVAVRAASIGTFKDEYEDYFLFHYHDKLRKHGKVYADRWAYRYAAKTVFYTAWEWTKVILIVYLKLAGK